MALRSKTPLRTPDRMVPANPPGVIAPNLVAMGTTTRLDQSAATAPGQGLAAIGQGLERAGSATEMLAQKMKEADTVVAEREATVKMQKANWDIQTAIAGEPDKTKWSGIVNEHMDALQSELGKMNVAPDIRKLIDFKFAGNRVDVEGGVKTHAARKTLSDATEAIHDTAVDMATHQNKEGAYQTVDSGVESNLISEAQGSLLKTKIDGIVEDEKLKAQKESILGAVRENPQQAFDSLRDDKKTPGLSEATRAWGINQAQQGIRENKVAGVERFENAVSAGEITTPEQVNEWEKDNPRITPRMREDQKWHVYRMTNAMQKEIARANAPENSSKLLSELADVDPETATDEQMANLRQRIAELPQGYRELPYSRFTRKWREHEKDLAPSKTVQEFGDNILHDMLGAGNFGAWSNWQPVKRADGTVVLDTETGLPKRVYTTDHDAYQKALEAKSIVGGKLARWLQGNPKATEEDVRKKLLELVPDATRAGLFDSFDKAAAKQGLSPVGAVAEPNANILIGGAPTKTEPTKQANKPTKKAGVPEPPLPDNQGTSPPGDNPLIPLQPPQYE